MSLQKISPKMKSRSSCPMSVNGMQNTPSSKSETAKFNRNMFVTVRMRRFCSIVSMTSTLPIIPKKKIILQSHTNNKQYSIALHKWCRE